MGKWEDQHDYWENLNEDFRWNIFTLWHMYDGIIVDKGQNYVTAFKLQKWVHYVPPPSLRRETTIVTISLLPG